jgi:hypothetical protein
MRTITQAVAVGFVALSIALISGHPASATVSAAPTSHVAIISADGSPSLSSPLDTPWG